MHCSLLHNQQLFTIGINIIGICVVTLIVHNDVEAVTPTNPCDIVRSNQTVQSLFSNEMKKQLNYLDILPSWLTKPLKFVNCSKRGLTRIPTTIPYNVQFLDLSTNSIKNLAEKDFKNYNRIQVLLIHSNCIGNSQKRRFYCPDFKGVLNKNSFRPLINLKLLDLSGNSFVSLPPNLPKTLEYLDVSRTGLYQITKNSVNYLTRLAVLLASDMCFYCNVNTGKNVVIDPNAFAGVPLQMVKLYENRINMTMLSKVGLKKVLFLSLSRSFITFLQPSFMENFSSVKRLDLQLLNPNKREVHLKIADKTFDKLKDLIYLNLCCNLIRHIPKDIFQHNTKLKTLDLSGNCLAKIVLNPIFVPRQITTLYLGYNQCQHLNFSRKGFAFGPFFKNLSNLQTLTFGEPKFAVQFKVTVYSQPLSLTVIDNQTFSSIQNLPNLTEIIIANGVVEKIDLTTLQNIQGLNHVDLFNNKISNISSSAPLSTNMSCNTDKRFLKLILSNNMLQNLHKSQLIHSNVNVLDLSVNLITHTRSNLFEYMPCLEYIDLRTNPIQYLHYRTFIKNKRLKHILIKSTYIISSYESLTFLGAFEDFMQVRIAFKFADDSLFRLLYKAATIEHTKARYVTEAYFSYNTVPSERFIEVGLSVIPNVKLLSLSHCDIESTYFQLPTSLIQNLDISHNYLKEITNKFLKSIPCVETLLFSYNYISYVEMTLFKYTPNLTHLDLSHNQITHMIKGNGTATFDKLKKLELQNNYIYKLSTDIFSLSFLSQLEYIDLRWNSIECYCELTLTVGRWLLQQEYDVHNRPGFLPVCTYELDMFGGCVTCTTNQCSDNSLLKQSLLQYATRNFCSNSLGTIFTVCYTSTFFLFICSAMLFTSNKVMLCMAKVATRRIRLNQRNNTRPSSNTFVFDGYIIFDVDDSDIGDWVDDQLVPQMTHNDPKLIISVIGKDDGCGFSPTTQLLYKMEASRKIVILLTKDYGLSRHGKYVLSNVEYLSFQTGFDRAIIVTFENDVQVGGLLKRRQKQANMSLLQFPNDKRCCEIFWENLCFALLCQ